MVTIEVVAIIDSVVWLSAYVDSGDDSMDIAYAVVVDADISIFDALFDVVIRSGVKG